MYGDVIVYFTHNSSLFILCKLYCLCTYDFGGLIDRKEIFNGLLKLIKIKVKLNKRGELNYG